jgi:hypothetical protein
MEANVLAQELATYAAEKESLLADSLGKYVVISGDRVLGTWDTFDEALTAGYSEVGIRPFLVREVRPVEEVHYIY